MQALDYAMLLAYLVGTLVIGVLAMRHTKTQSDYFLGGRSFGKLMQTFAAFGAGTGAHEPVTVGRAIWVSGLSGVWIAMQWLFVTPIYWITAVWYRRMRHLTLGDWFVERYESRALGAAFTVYTLCFYMAFLSVMLTAITKFAVPLLGFSAIYGVDIAFYIIPTLAVTVIIYGVLGGLTAAYWTDLVQGFLIIILSVLLVPFGLSALVQKYGAANDGLNTGFEIMHRQVAPEMFSLFSGPSSGEFPLLYIVSFTLLSLVGIVVHPHFIATGGGSAKTEFEARVGLVAGNFLKRLCTVGWALTALIALTLLAGNPEIASDTDLVWGVAAREILGPLNLGLVGLMFACLLAAMMSSADTYMLVSSAVVVRNVYAAYFDPHASEARYVAVGRVTGVILVTGATVVALLYSNVMQQFQMAMEIPLLFAAPFWLGLYWRRVNTWAVWLTIGFSLLLFFVLPVVLPMTISELRTDPRFSQTTNFEQIFVQRPATQADVDRHQAWLAAKNRIENIEDPAAKSLALKRLGAEPPQAELGQPLEVKSTRGGTAIYWKDGVEPKEGTERQTVAERTEGEQRIVTQQWNGPVSGKGTFQLDFLIYERLGFDFSTASKATLEALRLPTRLILPFIVLVVLSYLTPRNSATVLDRYYAKMKTPVLRDPVEDQAALDFAYQNRAAMESRKLFPGSDWEMMRPTKLDVFGFVVSVLLCGFLIGLLVWVASIGVTGG